MTACNKENTTFNTDTVTPSTDKAVQTHNHTHAGRKCSSKAHTEEKMLDPTYREARQRNISKFERKLKSAASRSSCNTPTIVMIELV